MTDSSDAKRALLAEWKEKRDHYDMLYTALARELGENGPSSIRQPDAVSTASSTGGIAVNDLVRPGDFFGKTQVDAIQMFLDRTNRQSATLQEIAAALFRGKATETLLEGDKLRNLSSLLSKTEIFFPVARGRWGLSDWYPGKQRPKRGKDATQENGDLKKESAKDVA
jgi:hypothetical protein